MDLDAFELIAEKLVRICESTLENWKPSLQLNLYDSCERRRDTFGRGGRDGGRTTPKTDGFIRVSYHS